MEYKEVDNKKYWEEYYKTKERHKPSSFYQSIKDKINDTDIILDVGAGDGRDTYPLSARCKQICVVEPNNDLPWSNFKSLNDVSIPFDVMYARFFFHAVDEATEDYALNLATQNKAQIFAEFRVESTDDVSHYRRPIEPSEFVKKLLELGYTKVNLSIGNFSPYGNDNPKLARIHAKI